MGQFVGFSWIFLFGYTLHFSVNQHDKDKLTMEILKKFWAWLGSARLNTIITALTNLFGPIGLAILATISVLVGVLALIWKFDLFKKREKNPYTAHTPVTPPNFVGREILLKQLATALEKMKAFR